MPPHATLGIATLIHALGARACHFDIDLLEQCDSTNSVLLERAEKGAASGSVVVARVQSAGRGRRGRAWISAAGDSLTFSLLWRLPQGVSPAGLSLAAGLAVVRALEGFLSAGASVGADRTLSPVPAQLKWPNDILLSGRKLGGILVELLPGATRGSNAAVIGCGINLRLPSSMPDELRAQSAALEDVISEPDPNAFFSALLIALRDTLEQFTHGSFASLQTEWMAHDAFANQAVRVLSEFAPPLDGICRGVNADGTLRLEVDGKIQQLLSGEVSLRPLR